MSSDATETQACATDSVPAGAVANVFAADLDEDFEHGSYRHRSATIGKRLGASQIAMNLYELLATTDATRERTLR